jgi:hypothetical protein
VSGIAKLEALARECAIVAEGDEQQRIKREYKRLRGVTE